VKYPDKIFLCCLLLVFGCVHGPRESDHTSRKAVYSEAQMVEIGRRIYQEGVLANGEPVRATVMGGVEVAGNQFTCVHCHRRSGLGGPEGPKYVPPTNGDYLFAPREKVHMERPSYNDQTLAEAIADGMNPLGEAFDEIMPIYDLPDLEMDGLIAYLKELSSEFSPGIDDQAIHIGTVVDVSVDKTEREAMLAVINSYFDDKNSKSRIEHKRRESGPFYHEYKNKAYRQWQLHVWEVSGPPETWSEQLEEYYRRQPVFTLFSGLVNGPWEPIHNFCEDHQIPSLLPNTFRPVVGEDADFYTLYYSKGLVLEAQVAITDLESEASRKKVLQVYRQGNGGAEGAAAMRSLSVSGDIDVHDLAFRADAEISGMGEVTAMLRQTGADTMIFWLNADDLSALANARGRLPDTFRIYFSSSMIGGEQERIPEFFQSNSLLLHQYNLPGNHGVRFRRTAVWLKSRDIPLTSPLLQGQTFFACMVLREGLMHIRRNFYRDYLMDVLDHVQRMAGFVGNYPRVSFGPEQRYLAKGAYVVDPKNRSNRWIVPDR